MVAQTGRPNILYIDAHDLGDWLGCYARPYLHTPYLDRLAAQGALFEQFIATAPICMPSRATTFTGVMPHMTGVTGQDPLDQRFRCLPDFFRRAGYETVVAGGLMVPNDPHWVGFDRILPAKGDAERAAAAATFLSGWAGAATAGPAALGDAAHRGTQRRPFYLHVSFTHVHRPFGLAYDREVAATIDVPPALPDMPVVRRDLATLARNVEELDALAGQILEALDRSGLAGHTLVVFTTEHGVATARAKHTLYDPGIKIALAMRYPGHIAPGTRCHQLLSALDLLPTVLDLASLEPPSDILGRSFAPLLRGAPFAGRDAVFAEHSWGRRSGRYHFTPARCLRTERWKLIHHFTSQPPYVDNGLLGRFRDDLAVIEHAFGAPSPPDELYDLRDDPHEVYDLSGNPACATMLTALRHRLFAFLEATHDPILQGWFPNSQREPDTPQWVEQPDGSFRLAPGDPVDAREFPFPPEEAPPRHPAQPQPKV